MYRRAARTNVEEEGGSGNVVDSPPGGGGDGKEPTFVSLVPIKPPPMDLPLVMDAALWGKRLPVTHGVFFLFAFFFVLVLLFSQLEKRVILYKHDGSGYFLQHPMSELHWAEYFKKTDTVKGWRGNAAPVIGVELSTELTDVSIPNEEQKMMLEITIVGPNHPVREDNNDPDWVAVGSYGDDMPLVCPRKTGCYYKHRKTAPSSWRTLYKNTGGAIQECAGGTMWVESNQEGGDWLYKFGVMLANKKEIITLDHSRDMWIKIKPPPGPPGTPYVPTRSLLGQQKDPNAASRKFSMDFSPWTLLSESCDPGQSCQTTLKILDKKYKEANAGPPLHMVFSVDGGKRYEWLVQAFQFWWKRSQNQKKGSTMTRLLSSRGPDHLMDKVPTFWSAEPEEFKTDRYVPYNKIVSVLKWIQQEHKNLPPDAIVVIMDVDIVLLEDISYMAVNVRKGHPMGAHGFMSFSGEGSMYDKVVDRYCPECNGRADPLAVPYFIHKDDLLELAPKWLEMCHKIRKDTLPWDKVNDWRKESPLQLSWTAEQWAYLLSAAKMGLYHVVREDMSDFTADTKAELKAPMIHFSDWTVGKGPKGEKMKWNKHEDALKVIPNVDPKMGGVNRAMIEALQDFRAAVYPELKPDWAER